MKMKKLILSVFALSAMMLSACSGGEATSSSEGASSSATTSQQQSSSAAQSSSAEASSSEDASSSDAGSSSSEEPVTVKADYRVEIGDAVYDLVLDERTKEETGHDKQYTLGTTGKNVTKDDVISFKKLQNNEYSAFAVEPSGDATDLLKYNNVVKVGDDYKIRATAEAAQLYLKLDGETWSYWLEGGGDMPDPFYTGYRLAYGENTTDATWGFNEAIEGELAASSEEDVLKQLKFTITVPAGKTYGAKVRNAAETGTEWYGEKYAQAAYQTEEEDGNLVLPEGKYDIYFKLKAENAHDIWVNKYGPATYQHLYYAVNGEMPEQNLKNRVENLKNQFYLEDIALNNGDIVTMWFDKEMTQSAFPKLNEANDQFFGLFTIQYSAYIPYQLTVVRKGIYSVYFDEVYDSDHDSYLFDINTLKKAEHDNLDCNIKVIAEEAIPAGRNVYVLGLDGKWDNPSEANILTPNNDRTEWSRNFKLSDAANLFKFVIWDGEATSYDWDTLNPGRYQYINRCAFGGENLCVDLRIPEVPTTFNVVLPVAVPAGYNIYAAGINGWDLTANNILTPNDARTTWSRAFNLKENQDYQFKFVIWDGENAADWTQLNPGYDGEGNNRHATGGSVYSVDFTPTPFVPKEYTIKKAGVAIDSLDNIVEENDAQNDGIYLVDLHIGDVITVFDDLDQQLQYGDAEPAVMSFTATKEGVHTFYMNKSDQVYVKLPNTIIPLTLDSSFTTQFADRTYFIHSWGPSGTYTDFFTEAGNVELIDGATGYIVGVLKDTKTEADDLGDDWANVEPAPGRTGNLTNMPNTSLKLYYTSSAISVWVDGVDPNLPANYIVKKQVGENPATTLEGLVDLKGETANHAIYRIELAIGDKITCFNNSTALKLGDSDDTEFTATKAGIHTFFINDADKVYVDEPLYYLAGIINGENHWDVNYKGIQLVRNPTVEGEYELVSPVALAENDGIKVVNGSVYYPNGTGDEWSIDADGNYNVWFRPAGKSDAGWNGYFYVGAAS